MAKNPTGIKEYCRKRLVGLKRKPHMIPLVVLAIAFIYYSFNLSQVSNTTALINGPHMGLTEFGTMLPGVLHERFPAPEKGEHSDAGADAADGGRADLL